MVINRASSYVCVDAELETGRRSVLEDRSRGRNNEPSDVDALERHSREGIAQAERKDRTSEQSGKHECK